VGKGPWITLKMAMSADGHIAAGEGVRTTITGPEAGVYVHRLRAGHDAILIGGRTAVIDDPLLTVRNVPLPRRPPLRIVLDSDLSVSARSRLLETASEVPTMLLCRADAPEDRRRLLEKRGAEVVPVTGGSHGLDLTDVMRVLEARGVESVLVEGGGRLATALLDSRLVHRQHLLYAPGSLGAGGVAGIGLPSADDREWTVIERGTLGDDRLVVLESTGALEMLMEAA